MLESQSGWWILIFGMLNGAGPVLPEFTRITDTGDIRITNDGDTRVTNGG